MSTLTLGIVVILYMFVIAWLGYIGYKQTKNASDYLLGGRKVNPMELHLFLHRLSWVLAVSQLLSVWVSSGYVC